MLKPGIIFVPEYIKKSIEIGGRNIKDILEVDYPSEDRTIMSAKDVTLSKTAEEAIGRLSRNDRGDLYLANSELYRALDIDVYVLGNILIEKIKEQFGIDVDDSSLTNMVNLLIDYDTADITDTFEFQIYKGTILVVLNDGFTNLVLQDSDGQFIFFKYLIEFSFNNLEYLNFVNSDYFTRFINLTTNKIQKGQL